MALFTLSALEGLSTQAGLEQAALCSLFCNKEAASGDQALADNQRGGWHGQDIVDAYRASKFWLFRRAKATSANRLRLEREIESCLAWLIEAGAASAISVTTTANLDGINFTAIITSPLGDTVING